MVHQKLPPRDHLSVVNDLRSAIRNCKDDYMIFELLEKLADFADSVEDIEILVNLLENYPNGIIRHEAAAQLAEIWQKHPALFKNVNQRVVASLMKCAKNDTSRIARHEAIEALGYVGDKSVLKTLREIRNDEDEDIQKTAEIAIDIIEFRARDKMKSIDLWKSILAINKKHGSVSDA